MEKPSTSDKAALEERKGLVKVMHSARQLKLDAINMCWRKY